MNGPKISIIVPVYNVEKYLSKCINSILSQTYKNIEVICVNDQSPDSSLNILKEYNDERLIVIDKENEGVSAARNDALKVATGEYVLFVDSDDWIESNMCDIMLAKLQEFDADVCMCCYSKEFGTHSKVEKIFDGDCVFFGQEFKDKFYRRLFGLRGEELKFPETADSIVSVWMQLFKKSLVEGIAFVDLKLIGTAEDLMFQIEAYKNCNRLVYVDMPLYHYRKDNEQSITSVYKEKLFCQRNYMFDLMENIINENNMNVEYSEALNNRIAFDMIGQSLNERCSKKGIIGKSKSIGKILNTPRYKKALNELDFSYLPIHWKIFFMLCRYRLSLLVVIMAEIIEFLRRR